MTSGARQPDGTFAPGNQAARGRNARRVESWRRAFGNALKPADVREVMGQLIAAAKAGEAWAVKLLLDRALGPPEAMDLLARLDAIEERLGLHDGQ